MLQISGVLKGVTYKEDDIHFQDLMDILDVKDLHRDMIRFNVGFKRWDKLNNRYKVPQRVIIPMHFTGVLDGAQVTIRYYTSKHANQNNMGWRYVPEDSYGTQRHFMGKQLVMSDENMELAVYWLLYPKCKESPFYTKGGEILYSLDVPERQAKEDLDKQMVIFNAQKSILTETDVDFLRRKAMGLSFLHKGTKKTIPGAHKMGLDQLKSELLKLVALDALQFSQKWSNPETNMNGYLAEAVSRRIIKPVSDHGGQTWRWSDAEGGATILHVYAHQNPTLELQSHYHRHIGQMLPKIKNALDKLHKEDDSTKATREFVKLEEDARREKQQKASKKRGRPKNLEGDPVTAGHDPISAAIAALWELKIVKFDTREGVLRVRETDEVILRDTSGFHVKNEVAAKMEADADFKAKMMGLLSPPEDEEQAIKIPEPEAEE